jgi:hypothetical protein
VTTLVLARAIANAAIADYIVGGRSHRNERDGPTQAVLRVLRDTGHWFGRVVETPTRTVLERREEEG